MATHDPQALQRWTTIIDNWRNSGLSVAAFCRSLGVNKSGFHRWRNIIQQLQRGDPHAADSTTRRRRPPTVKSKAFVPVRVVADPVVEVSLCASARRHDLNPWHYLRDVLTAMASKPSELSDLLPDVWAARHLPANP